MPCLDVSRGTWWSLSTRSDGGSVDADAFICALERVLVARSMRFYMVMQNREYLFTGGGAVDEA